MAIVINKGWHKIIESESARYGLENLFLIPIPGEDFQSFLMATDGRSLVLKRTEDRLSEKETAIPADQLPKKNVLLDNIGGRWEAETMNGKKQKFVVQEADSEATRRPPIENVVDEAAAIVDQNKHYIALDAKRLADIQEVLEADSVVVSIDPDDPETMMVIAGIKDGWLQTDSVAMLMPIVPNDLDHGMLQRCVEELAAEFQEAVGNGSDKKEESEAESEPEPEPEPEPESEPESEPEPHQEEEPDVITDVVNMAKSGNPHWDQTLKLHLVGRSREEAAEIIAKLAEEMPQELERLVETFEEAQTA